MRRVGISGLVIMTALSLLALALPAMALSVDQVIALKKAGVSDETIRQMIHTEIKVRSMGGVGSYTVRQKGGDEWIVYEAATPQGVIDYPWDTEQYYPSSNLGSVATVLDSKLPGNPKKKPRPRSSAKNKKASSAKGYTLHLSSYQKQAGAKEEVAKLAKQGVQARMETVDLADKGRWHRVLVGSFKSKDQARAQGQRLAKSGSISSFRVMPR
jgi:septal ring-binding cell division protein DamX